MVPIKDAFNCSIPIPKLGSTPALGCGWTRLGSILFARQRRITSLQPHWCVIPARAPEVAREARALPSSEFGCNPIPL